jgi:hypothetical protein
MPSQTEQDPFVFFIETHFQKMARRPGGIARENAIAAAQAKVEELRPAFHNWLDDKLLQLEQAVEGARSAGSGNSEGIDTAILHSRALRDVGATLGFELISFIANNLCEILEAENLDLDLRIEAIECHVQALLLARQDRYRELSPTDVPELTEGLRLVAASGPGRV